MNHFGRNLGLRPRDVVIVPKSDLRIVRHYLVYEGVNYLGQEVYLENNFHHGVRRISGETFAYENPTYLSIRRFTGNDYQRGIAVQRAIALIGNRYNLLTFNCEHYANFVQYGNAHSGQVANGGVAAALLLLLCCI